MPLLCQSGHPKGCMVALGVMSAPTPAHAAVSAPLTRSRARTRAGIVACIERGVASGALRADTDVRALATVFDSFLLGLSTLARDGVRFTVMEAAIGQVMGLWDGDSWNYLLWGAAHGVALCVDRLWSRSSLPRIPSWLSHTLTLLFVFMAWTLFRAPDFAAAMNMYAGQLGMHDVALGDALAVTLRSAHGLAALLGVACIIAPLFKDRVEQRFGTQVWFVPIAALWPVAGFLLSFALIASREAVPFLYFQF